MDCDCLTDREETEIYSIVIYSMKVNERVCVFVYVCLREKE